MFCFSCQKKVVKIKAPPLTPVSVAKVEQKDIPFYIETLGHFAAFNTVTMQAQIQGELTGLYFIEGQEVRKNELLFTINSAPYQASLDKSIATLKQNEATLAYTKSRADRYSYLVGDNFVSQLEYDRFVTEMQSSEAIIKENLAEIESAEIDVGYCTLTSPIDGVAGKKLIDVGNIITDVGTELLVINQVSPLYIDFSIPERYFDIVSRKQRENPLLIEINIPSTEIKTTARVQMIDNTINAKTGMIALRGILPNECKDFWPQQFVKVVLIVDTIKDAIMVPPEAVLASSKGEFVWALNEDQTVKTIFIETGEQYNKQIRVTKGLKAGDTVITKGQLTLNNGKKVAVVKGAS